MTELKARNGTEQIIVDYINQNASDVLCKKIKASGKTMAGCMDFIRNEAKKKAVNGCACIEDKEVFGWAIHYFEEETLNEEKKPVKKPVVKAEDKEKKPSPKPKAKEQDVQLEGQLDIFDILGGA
jgi:hypothetical protein